MAGGTISVYSRPGEGSRFTVEIPFKVMDGYETTKALRALRDGDKLKIIALSANAYEEDVQKSLECGMNVHVAKPINVDELFDTMRDLRTE